MKRDLKVDIFSATNSLKVLSFLADSLGKELLGREIAKITGVSRGGAYLVLKGLIRQKLVCVHKRGRFSFYSINYSDAAIKQFKALKNVLSLRTFVSKLMPFSRKIILYGSYARGENYPSSDIDLFITAKDPETIKDAVSSIKTKQKIRAVIKTSAELADFKENETVFMQEVERGIVLWEEKE